MTKNTYFVIGLVLILIIAGLIFVNKRKGGGEVLAPTGKESAGNQLASPAPQPPGTATQTITYADSGFSPQSLTIEAGDTVIFKNNSDSNFWPASGPHPAHANYPEFDAKKAISTGGSYSFTFTRTGSWKYHNHLNPASTGTIVVQ